MRQVGYAKRQLVAV